MAFVHLLACCAGLLTAALCLFVRRFGEGSRLLAFYLVPVSLSTGTMALIEPAGPVSTANALKIALALLALSAPGGLIASYAIECRDSLSHLTRKWMPILIASAAGIAAAVLISRAPVVRPDPLDLSQDLMVFGLPGYGAALYMLVVAVMSLANLEQTIRSLDEHLRWEVKFLAIGLGASFAVTVYLCSTVLLYSPRYAHVSLLSVRLLGAVFLLSCLLILVSWRRSSGRGRVFVSHGLVYSSITLLCVGLYLIASSLLARWASESIEPEVPVAPLVFLLLVLVLAIALLATEFRQRARSWIRRHLLGGHYDYREFWLEATGKIRSIDPPEQAASSLAQIVQRALGAIDVSVWLRLREPNRLELLASVGAIGGTLDPTVSGVAEKLVETSEPLTVDGNGNVPDHPDIDPAFLQRTRAALLVPLVSGNRLVGVLTVGSDRSGRPYGWEAQEFLQVLANHAAGELHKTELLSSILQAKEAEAFQTFSTFLLHDLKNFASTLSLIARNAVRHQSNPDFQRDSFQSVQEIAGKMKHLCNSLRSFAGGLATEKSSQDLNELVTSVTRTLEGGLAGRMELELGELPHVLADGEEISRVVHNLVLNAHEAVNREDGRILIRTAMRDGYAEIAVEDNGRGMTGDFLEKRLYRPFHTTKSDGLGIGLFQCKKIVEAHGGEIRVESEAGKGTVVRILLPLIPGGAPQRPGSLQ